jgi:hypothetical protein
MIHHPRFAVMTSVAPRDCAQRLLPMRITIVIPSRGTRQRSRLSASPVIRINRVIAMYFPCRRYECIGRTSVRHPVETRKTELCYLATVFGVPRHAPPEFHVVAAPPRFTTN